MRYAAELEVKSVGLALGPDRLAGVQQERAKLFVKFHRRCEVSAPATDLVPNPISATDAPSGAPTDAAILRIVFGSRRKFWPRLFFGRMLMRT